MTPVALPACAATVPLAPTARAIATSHICLPAYGRELLSSWKPAIHRRFGAGPALSGVKIIAT